MKLKWNFIEFLLYFKGCDKLSIFFFSATINFPFFFFFERNNIWLNGNNKCEYTWRKTTGYDMYGIIVREVFSTESSHKFHLVNLAINNMKAPKRYSWNSGLNKAIREMYIQRNHGNVFITNSSRFTICLWENVKDTSFFQLSNINKHKQL